MIHEISMIIKCTWNEPFDEETNEVRFCNEDGVAEFEVMMPFSEAQFIEVGTTYKMLFDVQE